VTPVSQFYWQQAYANVVFGPWKQIAPGYGRMVLGYFGRTPVAPDPEIVALASKQLKLAPTTRTALELADADPAKSLQHFEEILRQNGIETTEENIFIAASCGDKGLAFLKGEAKVNVRKESSIKTEKGNKDMAGQYTVVVNGKKYNVDVVEGHDGSVSVTQAAPAPAAQSTQSAPTAPAAADKGSIEVHSQTPGNIWKIVANVGDHLKEGDTIMILEAMKMEIDISAPQDGIVKSIEVAPGDTVVDGQLLATMG